jgi:two-component system, OmpR family, sensor histidine kinase PhoQ
MNSLSRRLLISVAALLVLVFGTAMALLDIRFQQLLDQQRGDAIDSQMIKLIALAEPQPGGGYWVLPRDLDPQLAVARSGVYAQIRSPKHRWRSPSVEKLDIDFGPPLREGERQLAYRALGKDHVAVESRGIKFEDDPNPNRALTFSVAVSLSADEERLWRFRSELLGSLVGLLLVLLVVIALVLRWALSPARRLEREIQEVEAGNREALSGGYPRELRGVASNLNALLQGERKRVKRYRDTLGNLAHSLKTPLAVMRAALSADEAPQKDAVGAEIDRMTGIIEHQLKRAAASGGALLGAAPVDVAQVAQELRGALLRVYGSKKDLSIELAITPGSQFIGDRSDFTELLGNLMDNACKWCKSRVRVIAYCDEQTDSRERLRLTVEDDGPGISQENRQRVLQRGVRTDESVPGHGIGLTMVHDTIDLYGGWMVIEWSELGGARITMRLPGRAEAGRT